MNIKLRYFSAILFLIASLVSGYPAVASIINNHTFNKQAAEYSRSISHMSSEQSSAALEEAEAYNKTLPGLPILDPYSTDVSKDKTGDLKKYISVLSSAGPVMAQLKIPAIDVELPIYHGTSQGVLAHGVGHIYGTSLPVGGLGTRSVLTTHSGYQTATLFDHINKLVPGDDIYIEVYGRKLHYKVTDTETILPSQSDKLTMKPGKDIITLMTCTPYGVNTHRLLVNAERADDASAPETNDIWSPVKSLDLRIKVMLAISIVTFVMFVVQVVPRKKKDVK